VDSAREADTGARRSAGLAAARIGAATVLGLLALAVLRPFLVPLLWAAILAYSTWPVYRRLPTRARWPRLSAAGLTLALAVGLGGPVGLLLVSLAQDATRLAGLLLEWQGQGFPLPAWAAARLAEQPWLAGLLETARSRGLADAEAVGQWLGRAASQLSGQIVGIATGLVRNAAKFGVAMVAVYGFYLSGERLIDVGRRLAPLLFPVAPARFLESIGEAVHAVFFGLLGTALAQGVLAGAGLAVAGVPSPVALGTATALLSVLPGGGSAVTLVAAVWLALSGRVVAGVALAVWSLLVVSSMDNLLRPLLISGRAQIPFLVVFLGVLGGLAGFGLVGAFVGPVILSVAFALVSEFSRLYTRHGRDAERAA
jgi:predicted PurR-regulated permease PerM